MRKDLTGIIVRVGVFVTACLCGTFALMVVFAQVRFGDGKTYNAEFTNVSNLKEGNFVRIAGVEVGKVKSIVVNEDATVRVEFEAEASAVLTEGTRAEIRYDDLIGGRYLALEEGAGDLRALAPGDTIPVSRTKPALDLDSVMGGFRPLLRGFNPDQINALSGQLVTALQGQGPAIALVLEQAGTVTDTLADRDLLIGQLIDNLDAVLGTVGGQTDQLDKAVVSLSELVQGLAERKNDISNAVAYTNAAAGSIADLLTQAREPVRKVVYETDRTAAQVLADEEYLDNLLEVLPDKYRALNRQAIYGDYYSFYFCDVIIKLNGKGGQPVYTKVAGQSTGRCAPK
ncbi:MCE family protein [Mycolicibacillus trivialis]|uniref:Mammalian cell entry protein n=1 Tax=Mycolicibacillus trivialis TaxID=1798 RepID=A0A1X2EKG3_9MYCO|nr:MCE family protein [Mycolicibacillus trivialis]ORX05067.1 mammalian cell entry protein [Mycolicibacillus trivialis]